MSAQALQLWAGTSQRSFLRQLLESEAARDRLSPERWDGLVQEWMALASRRVGGRVLNMGPERSRLAALSETIRRVSLGLEHLSDGNPDRALALLSEGTSAALYRKGDELLRAVGRAAAQVREQMILSSGLPTALVVLEELDLANTIEALVLEALQREERRFHQPQPRLTTLLPAQPMDAVDDLRHAAEQLRYFQVRVALFRSFPPDRLFAQAAPVDPLGDAARIVISRLLVHIAVHGENEPRFDVTPEDVALFRHLMEEPTTQQRLGQWIQKYTDALLSGEDAARAATYLQSCLEELPDALDLLTEPGAD